MNSGLSTSASSLSSEITKKLLETLGLSPFLLESQCDQQDSPFLPNTNGWNNGKTVMIKTYKKGRMCLCQIGFIFLLTRTYQLLH